MDVVLCQSVLEVVSLLNYLPYVPGAVGPADVIVGGQQRLLGRRGPAWGGGRSRRLLPAVSLTGSRGGRRGRCVHLSDVNKVDVAMKRGQFALEIIITDAITISAREYAPLACL